MWLADNTAAIQSEAMLEKSLATNMECDMALTW